MNDSIHIEGIKVMSRMGVPDEERKKPQELEISVTLFQSLGSSARTDRLDKTIDYARVHHEVLAISQERPRKLIETLAEELCDRLLVEFRPVSVEVEIRKFILPGTRFVAVRMKRTQKIQLRQTRSSNSFSTRARTSGSRTSTQ